MVGLQQRAELADWRLALAKWVESARVRTLIIVVFPANALVSGLETSPAIMAKWGGLLVVFDHFCLGVFA